MLRKFHKNFIQFILTNFLNLSKLFDDEVFKHTNNNNAVYKTTKKDKDKKRQKTTTIEECRSIAMVKKAEPIVTLLKINFFFFNHLIKNIIFFYNYKKVQMLNC